MIPFGQHFPFTDFSITYDTYEAQTPDQSSYTFTNKAISTPPGPDRYVIVILPGVISSATLANTIPSSVTIGGVSATLLVSQTHDTTGSTSLGTSMWIAKVPTGTTVTIVANYPATQRRGAVTVFSANLSSPTPSYSGSGETPPDTTDLTQNVTCNAGGKGISGINEAHTAAGRNFTVSGTAGATEVLDALIEGGIQAGASTFTASGTVIYSAINDRGWAGVWASWSP